ncbi:MAG: hypothetical protein ACO1NX_07105 [Chitinophagaceae bacterium]
MEKFEYKDIIPMLRNLFPEFMNDEELNGLCSDVPGLYLTFLIGYAGNNWNNSNTQIQLAQLMNQMAVSTDTNVRDTFLDFALDFYLHFEEVKIATDHFMNSLLLPQTKHIVLDAADYWYRANKDYNNTHPPGSNE